MLFPCALEAELYSNSYVEKYAGFVAHSSAASSSLQRLSTSADLPGRIPPN